MSPRHRQRRRAILATALLGLAALSGCTPARPISAEISPAADKKPVYDFARYPDAVWDKHLDLTRKATTVCGTSSATQGTFIGCLYSTLDGYVRAENNAALSDLHVHLPLYYRYERSRAPRPTALLPKPFPPT